MEEKIDTLRPVFRSFQKPITYQIGETEILYYPQSAATFREYNKVCICPHCFGTIHLGRNSEKHKWLYSREDYMGTKEFKLNCKNENEFHNHIAGCTPLLKYGVNKIDEKSPKRACSMVDFFSHSSKWGDHGHFIQEHRRIEKGDLIYGGYGAYMFIDELGPTSCAMFKYSKIDGNCNVPLLLDVYTFPPFRNQGYATQILEYAIEDLKIDKSSFYYLSPTCKEMDGIFNELDLNAKAMCFG